MIFANLNHNTEYLDEKIKKCLEYAKNNNLLNFETGIHQIDSYNFFVNIVSYDTTTRDERFWEAHKKYLDVHVMISGEEIIDISFTPKMDIQSYDTEKDFVSINGQSSSCVLLTKDDFLVCYPEDAHMTAIANGKPTWVKKAIFKVKL